MEKLDYTHEELQGLEDISLSDLDALDTAFNGLVSMMSLVGVKREEVVGLAHQSHHMGYDNALMEALASDERTLLRAEVALREKSPDALYFFLNNNY